MAKRTDDCAVLPAELIETRIYVLRGHRVILDRDLAELYGVETRMVNQAAKRNADRLPADFMFQLTGEEAEEVIALRSQSVILKRGQHLKYLPHVFTEHGAVMLANLLKSPRAIQASIQVVRAFVRLRRMLAANEELSYKLEAIERRIERHDAELQSILDGSGLSDQAQLPRIWSVSHRRGRAAQIVMSRVELADQLIQLDRRFPDFEKQQAARAAAPDAALAIDSGIVRFMSGAAAVEFARADLQG
jgi:hypothetical protein